MTTADVALRLPASPEAPQRARAFVQQRWTHLPSEVVDDAALIVSELVSNAVNATAEGLLVLLELHRGYARVEVVDGSSELPRIGRPGPTESHGRGLLLVAALASEWGVDARPPGKAVWARLAIPARATERMACREA